MSDAPAPCTCRKPGHRLERDGSWAKIQVPLTDSDPHEPGCPLAPAATDRRAWNHENLYGGVGVPATPLERVTETLAGYSSHLAGRVLAALSGPEVVESLARALHASSGYTAADWESSREDTRERWRALARVALAHLGAS